MEDPILQNPMQHGLKSTAIKRIRNYTATTTIRSAVTSRNSYNCKQQALITTTNATCDRRGSETNTTTQKRRNTERNKVVLYVQR